VPPNAQRPTPDAPAVSICIPTYNGTRWIEEAVQSALGQTFGDFELLVVDDASTDHTVERVRALGDPRVRVEINERNLGLVGNWNHCVRLARGEFVKFLFQDDLLYPECLERMLVPFRAQERVGMVFSRREVLLENPEDPRAQAWKAQYGDLHTQFERLESLNSGRELFEQYLRKGFRMNFVGEPTAVMVRRSCFDRVGLFNTRMHQGPDFEMWIRLMYFYDVGFLDEPLCAFRVHTGSTTRAHHRSNKPWLDMLWLIEGLLAHEEIRRSHPQIARLRWLEAARIVRSELRRLRAGLLPSPAEKIRSLAEYLRFRRGASAAAIHDGIVDER
jgi:glycosyltransferase involved in cell wall biosynthesis